jgi:hypothetical protein
MRAFVHGTVGVGCHVAVRLLLAGVAISSCKATHYPHKRALLPVYGSPRSVYGDYCCEPCFHCHSYIYLKWDVV